MHQLQENLSIIDDLLADLSQYVEHKQAGAEADPTHDDVDATLLIRIVEARKSLDVMLDDCTYAVRIIRRS